MATGNRTEDPNLDDPADAFLRLACLNYAEDSLERHEQARAMLAAYPELAGASIYTIAAVGDIAAARDLLAQDPAQAGRPGGPHNREPLLYLAFSRVDSTAPGHSTLEVARLLLQAGADPNAGYLWDGLPSPFTALTGAFGRGEDGSNQPPHQYETELARLLLDAGADPNDSQALYNRQFRPANDHLELLLAYGLGKGSGGPWHERLGPSHPTPAQLVEDQLLWAAKSNFGERVDLLVQHGVDPDGRGTGHPAFGGHSAYELARLHGNRRIADVLAAGGAQVLRLDPVADFIAAGMGGDAPALSQLVSADPALPQRVAAHHPDLLIRAAELGRTAAVQLLAAHGFDVNIIRRVSPLHQAAWQGDLAMVQTLLALGADPTLRDTEFNATPLDWARHNHQSLVEEYLVTLPGRAGYPAVATICQPRRHAGCSTHPCQDLPG